MSDKFKKRMKQVAFARLTRMLRKDLELLYPYSSDFPKEIHELIRHQLDIYPYPKEGEVKGPIVEGKAIANKLYDEVRKQSIPFVDRHLRKLKIDLEERRVGIELTNETIKIMEYKVTQGLIGENYNLWSGADVHVTARRIRKERLAWSHADDTQVVTGSPVLARSISGVFEQARDTMWPFLDYLNKYEFFGELAESAIEVINKDGAVGGANHQDVLVAILERTKIFQHEWLQMYRDHYDKRKKIFQTIDAWLLNQKPAPST